MDDFHYPALDEPMLNRIAQMYEAQPSYFESPLCPYTQKTKEIFKGVAKYQDFDTGNDTNIAGADDLLTQITQLSSELKAYGQSIKTDEATSASDRNTYFRLSVTLLEKLVDIKEKIGKIKDYEQFNNEVLDIMDKILTPDQRQHVMKRLELLMEPTVSGIADTKQEVTEQHNEPNANQD